MPHQHRLQRPASTGTVVNGSTTPQLKPPSPHQLRTPESQGTLGRPFTCFGGYSGSNGSMSDHGSSDTIHGRY